MFVHSLTLLHNTKIKLKSILHAQHVLGLKLKRPQTGLSQCFLFLCVLVLRRSLSPPAGRCWLFFHSWKETLVSPSPTAWPTVRQPRLLWETGPRLKPPTARSWPRTLTACTGPGRYDHRPNLSCTYTDSNPMNCQDHWKKAGRGGQESCAAQKHRERCVLVCLLIGWTHNLNVKHEWAAFLCSLPNAP